MYRLQGAWLCAAHFLFSTGKYIYRRYNMANFVCDICGGAIKMQANRTGVCQECGMEYDIEAIKAMAGKTMDTSPKPVSSATKAYDNKEIDKNSLIIYLNNVRTLETIIDQSKIKCDELEKKRNKAHDIIRIVNSSPEPKTPEKPKEPGKDDKTISILGIVLMVIGALCFLGLLLPMISSAMVLMGLVFMAIGIPLFIAGKKQYKENQQKRDKYKILLKEYEQEIEAYNEALIKRQRNIDEETATNKELIDKINESKIDVNSEINKFHEMLDKAYSANIIPMQFRTIEGVYYLYDYLSTSNQTLSEALMQANLEAIKQRLDDVIKLQSVNVIQQAQANAKLDNIVQQNVQILEKAERTAANTELAAKYAAISAVNSEIIKQLSQKELAYQRADFWLK